MKTEALKVKKKKEKAKLKCWLAGFELLLYFLQAIYY